MPQRGPAMVLVTRDPCSENDRHHRQCFRRLQIAAVNEPNIRLMVAASSSLVFDIYILRSIYFSCEAERFADVTISPLLSAARHRSWSRGTHVQDSRVTLVSIPRRTSDDSHVAVVVGDVPVGAGIRYERSIGIRERPRRVLMDRILAALHHSVDERGWMGFPTSWSLYSPQRVT